MTWRIGYVLNGFPVQLRFWIWGGNALVTSSVKKIVLGGCLTGLGSGLSWSVFELGATEELVAVF